MRIRLIFFIIFVFQSTNLFAYGSDEDIVNNKGLYLGLNTKHAVINSFGEGDSSCILRILENYGICIKNNKNNTVEYNDDSLEITTDKGFLYLKLSKNIVNINKLLCGSDSINCNKYDLMSEKSKIHKYYKSIIKFTPNMMINSGSEENEKIKEMLISKSLLVLTDAIDIVSVDVKKKWTGVMASFKHVDTNRSYFNLINKKHHLLILSRGFKVNYE